MHEYQDFRTLAQKKLPKQLFEFIDSGAFNESTIQKNNEDIRRLNVRKRVLRDVSVVDTSTTVLGQNMDLPLILGPVGFAGVYARRGEVQAARAAERARIPFCLSTLSICSIEEVAKAIKTPFWFQIYMVKDKGYCLELFQRAERVGCSVLVLTADLPMVGIRYRDLRNGMANGQEGLPLSTKLRNLGNFLRRPSWLYDVMLRGRPVLLGNFTNVIPELTHLAKMRHWVGSRVDSGLTWKDFEWVRANWKGKLVLKGVIDSEDAREAARLGADGIVVSNHAGRHLDSLPSTISVLPSIVKAVGSKLEVLMDGGVLNGLDLAKALAMGAKGCMIGRPWAFALAASGEQGVATQISVYKKELRNVMAHLGITRIQDLNKDCLI